MREEDKRGQRPRTPCASAKIDAVTRMATSPPKGVRTANAEASEEELLREGNEQ